MHSRASEQRGGVNYSDDENTFYYITPYIGFDCAGRNRSARLQFRRMQFVSRRYPKPQDSVARLLCESRLSILAGRQL